LAATLHRYPYGGAVRFHLYMGGAICLLLGIGAARLLAHDARRPWGALVLLAVMGVIGAGSLARDVWRPAKRMTDVRLRALAQSFWFNMSHDGEVVCLKTDLGQEFSEQNFHWGYSATYLCNQKIYSPRHARGEQPDWDRIAPDWPLRCVLYRSGVFDDFDEAAYGDWLARMGEGYRLVAQDRIPIPIYDKRDRDLQQVDYLEVMKFVPRAARGEQRMTRRETIAGR